MAFASRRVLLLVAAALPLLGALGYVYAERAEDLSTDCTLGQIFLAAAGGEVDCGSVAVALDHWSGSVDDATFLLVVDNVWQTLNLTEVSGHPCVTNSPPDIIWTCGNANLFIQAMCSVKRELGLGEAFQSIRFRLNGDQVFLGKDASETELWSHPKITFRQAVSSGDSLFLETTHEQATAVPNVVVEDCAMYLREVQ